MENMRPKMNVRILSLMVLTDFVTKILTLKPNICFTGVKSMCRLGRHLA